MLRNLSLGLVEHGRIRTTVARAKRLRSFIEPLVTRLKEPSVANLRKAHEILGNKTLVKDIADKVSPKFQTRPGGYLRIMKLARARPGDCADMALIEWVEESLVAAYNEMKPVAKKAAGKGGKMAAAKTTGDDEKSEKKAAKKAAPKKAAAKGE